MVGVAAGASVGAGAEVGAGEAAGTEVCADVQAVSTSRQVVRRKKCFMERSLAIKRSGAAGAAGTDACRRGGGVKDGAVYGALCHADEVEQLVFRVGGSVQLRGRAAVDAVGDREDTTLCQAGQRFSSICESQG